MLEEFSAGRSGGDRRAGRMLRDESLTSQFRRTLDSTHTPICGLEACAPSAASNPQSVGGQLVALENIGSRSIWIALKAITNQDSAGLRNLRSDGDSGAESTIPLR